MTRSSGFARITLTRARWLLPWIAVLFVSVALGYAMVSATHWGSSASDQPELHAAPVTGAAATATDVEQSSTPLSESMMEPSESRFAVTSMTSPASTGHASPNGCCTWD